MIELNLDGLVGPTHHYGGLAYGNQASTTHRHQCANPQAAALQGLKKMQHLHQLGIPQGWMPPPLRPHLALLRQTGFSGDSAHMVQQAFKQAPALLSAAYAASSMWTANAATVSSACDTIDGKMHLTPANLLTQLHRAIETDFTGHVLQRIFHDSHYFTHHPPLYAASTLADEGAANHCRFSQSHGKSGINLFVYGCSDSHAKKRPKRFPARQTLEASQCIARSHQLNPSHTFFAQQTPRAIDAGVFHNDVISLANESVFILHEHAFVNQKALLKALQKTIPFPFTVIEISEKQLPLKKAVATYLFNAQLVTLPNGKMTLIAPKECQEEKATLKLIESWIANPHHPIDSVHYIDLKQSMHNGGGPACLRLRVPLSEKAYATLPEGFLFNEKRFKQLTTWVKKHYRDRLSFEDLQDPQLMAEVEKALQELGTLLSLDCAHASSSTGNLGYI